MKNLSDINGAVNAIKAGKSISCGGKAYGNTPNFRGEPVSHAPHGWLKGGDFTKFMNADKDYIIFSYGTPIAWRCVNGEWETVNSKFSASTTKHQAVAHFIIWACERGNK